ncbi:hypothetical protein EMIHUDRAFT_226516 [Emiliania huxleyi CCMP1516]|uniref:Uncharacterized protein n=2 Tax=Emiliania huxleyi TaxID=2903 RepID=A0A0D3IFW7_EMIH1|nr:hypothetical protein EMIHUDRAFT_248500 [Emiliania huxleyi CCMP1516]XP_005788665.1 hypothetical protein EMIHUDRAFT_226516 [Emiliania huxleyi CCMP1516]EOD10152.1 hypothetical protein EMIHUDRAFT_248500 [Emiliania huxleyi CCMP1516]EOD36236.1 hypothetical protein EMIHUDRAFT_226516 [Emiliania huxleyi CCMP1516]|eukprot:XP_005762581.1 hypothetical protein EMIHUDRAFT_248500 [Emiliania huxleyi CCMP1516]
MRAQELAMTNGDGYRVVETRPWVNPLARGAGPNPLARGAGPNFPARGEGPDADQEDFALREWLRCSFEMCMSDRDREVVGEAARDRERIRPVDGGGGEDAGMGLGE